MRKACSTCPFDHSDQAENAINLGCVPSVFEIMSFKRDLGMNWGCHSAEIDEVRPCAGFIRACRKLGLDAKDGNHLSYNEWYRNGVPAP